jgi:hypothetical protein
MGRSITAAGIALIAVGLGACAPGAAMHTPTPSPAPTGTPTAASTSTATPAPTATPTATTAPTATTLPTATTAPASTPGWEGTRLPAPTGPYAVGHRRISVVDEARDEVHTADPADHRELWIDVWYPADPPPDGATPGPYIDERLAEALGLSEDANRWLGHAVEGASPAQAGGALPVLVFNAGFNAFTAGYTALLEEYASQGYVVAASSHPYVDQLALLADGEVVTYPGDEAFLAVWEGGDPFGGEIYLVWIPDTLAALQQLDALNDEMFGGRLQLDQLGFIGHSFGGGVAAETCRILAERCAGAVNLDGRNPDRLQELGMPAPYLYIAAEATGSASSDEVRAVVEHPLNEATVVEIAGATHSGFSDGALLAEARGQLDDETRAVYGEIDPARMAELVRRYTLAFFDRTVRGVDAPPLAELAESDPEVTVQTYTPD